MEKEVYQLASDLKEKHWWFLGRSRVITSVLKNSFKKSNWLILDVGCGAATSLPILVPFGRVIGVDKSQEAVNFCQNKGYEQLKKGEATRLPFSNSNFDLIAALDLLEHVKEDQKALFEFNRVCKKGGYLLVTVPAFSFFWSENDLATHHWRRYSKKDLQRKIEKAGFKIKKLTFFNSFLFPFFLVWHLGNLGRRKLMKNAQPKSTLSISLPGIINKIFTQIFSWETHFLPKINLPFGLSLICLATKK